MSHSDPKTHDAVLERDHLTEAPGITELSPESIASPHSGDRLDTTSDQHGDPDSSANMPPLSHEVNQSLARLEMNSLQVRLYLDSIEEKISRMEPRLEQMHSGQAVDAALPPVESDPEPETSTTVPPPASASPTEPPPAAGASTTDRRRRRQGVPLPFADRNGIPFVGVDAVTGEEPFVWRNWLLARRYKLAIAAAVILAFFLALFAFSGSSRPRSQTVSMEPVPANTAAMADGTSGSAVIAAIPKSSAGIAYTPAHPSASNGPLSTSPNPDTSATAPDPASSLSPDLPPTAGSAAALPAVDAASDPHATAPATPGTSRINTPSGRVHVSSGIMAGNLLSSHPPKYPGGLAALFRLQGRVTMQAVISRSGHVENLRVLSGHRLLRGAAQDAVRTWRYRPYAVNGMPVEVATIITVEFER